MNRRKPTAVQKMFMLSRGAKKHGMNEDAYVDMLHRLRSAMQDKAAEVEQKLKGVVSLPVEEP